MKCILRSECLQLLAEIHNGERADLALIDGTHIQRNSRTDLDILYSGSHRIVRLHAGEIAVRPGADPRPFRVETLDGAVHGDAGRYYVRRLAGARGSTAGVVEGRVRVACAQGPSVDLPAGLQCGFTATAIDTPVPLEVDRFAWTRGLLIASRQPLTDFMEELGRHRRGWISCDAALAGLRLSGSFPLADTDRVLAVLPDVLPVRVLTRTPLWVRVTAA